MNSVVEDIRNMIEAESSLGLTLGDNLHLYKEPAMPDNTVSIFETPGIGPLGMLDSNEDSKHYERPSIQVRIRNTDPQIGFALAYEIFNVLQARAHETWGDYYYSIIYAVASPAMLDWDANNRLRIVLNFNIQRRLT